MSSLADNSLWEKERIFLEGEKARLPEKFVIREGVRASLLQRVGILEDFSGLPEGYVKYSPYDFIVEEVLRDGTQITADDLDSRFDSSLSGEGTVYADLVKIGVSTLDAIQRISSALSIDIKKIGYAGIKDAVALTAQRISIRGSSIEAVKSLSIPGIFLKNIKGGKGAITVGDLKGNRFTLFIRTNGRISEDNILSRLDKIKRNGVMNYYGPQRFGSPRFLSHLFGLYILQGDIMGLLRSFLIDESPFEWPYVRDLRREASNHFGDWKVMADIFAPLPYTFRLEIELLNFLKDSSGPAGYINSLKSIQKQIELWPKAYASYLANRIMSEVSKGDGGLEDLPLLISVAGSKEAMYKEYLERDAVPLDFLKNLKKIPFLHVGESSSIKTRVRPEVHELKIEDNGVCISFSLDKGSYATTILMNLFDITGELPVPGWVNEDLFDTKSTLGTGSLSAVKDRFSFILEGIMSERQKGAGDNSL